MAAAAAAAAGAADGPKTPTKVLLEGVGSSGQRAGHADSTVALQDVRPGAPSAITVEQVDVEGVQVRVFTSALFGEGEEEEGRARESGQTEPSQQ